MSFLETQSSSDDILNRKPTRDLVLASHGLDEESITGDMPEGLSTDACQVIDLRFPPPLPFIDPHFYTTIFDRLPMTSLLRETNRLQELGTVGEECRDVVRRMVQGRPDAQRYWRFNPDLARVNRQTGYFRNTDVTDQTESVDAEINSDSDPDVTPPQSSVPQVGTNRVQALVPTREIKIVPASILSAAHTGSSNVDHDALPAAPPSSPVTEDEGDLLIHPVASNFAREQQLSALVRSFEPEFASQRTASTLALESQQPTVDICSICDLTPLYQLHGPHSHLKTSINNSSSSNGNAKLRAICDNSKATFVDTKKRNWDEANDNQDSLDVVKSAYRRLKDGKVIVSHNGKEREVEFSGEFNTQLEVVGKALSEVGRSLGNFGLESTSLQSFNSSRF